MLIQTTAISHGNTSYFKNNMAISHRNALMFWNQTNISQRNTSSIFQLTPFFSFLQRLKVNRGKHRCPLHRSEGMQTQPRRQQLRPRVRPTLQFSVYSSLTLLPYPVPPHAHRFQSMILAIRLAEIPFKIQKLTPQRRQEESVRRNMGKLYYLCRQKTDESS